MKWIKKNELQSLDLPKKTLLEVDLVTEYQREVSSVGVGERNVQLVYSHHIFVRGKDSDTNTVFM